MANFRIKVNLLHPTGSINLRDSAGRPLTIGRSWVPVDEVSESMEIWRKYLVIESTVEMETRNISDDSTVVKMGKVPVGSAKVVDKKAKRMARK